MPKINVEVRSNLFQKFDGMRKDLGFKITKGEYQVIATLIYLMIVERTRDYHLNAYCEPFVDYAWETERKKHPVEIDESWSSAQYILDQLKARISREAQKRARPEVIKAIQRQIGHFQTEINEAQKAFYTARAKEANDVNLIETGRMLDSIEAKGSANAARVKAKVRWANWIQKGVAAAKRQGKGALPARPFVGISDAELDWLYEHVLRPLYVWYADSLKQILTGGTPPPRPNAARLAMSAKRDKPTINDEKRMAG